MKHYYVLMLMFSLVFGNLKAQNTSGESLFDSSQIHEIRLQFIDDNYWELMTQHYESMIGTFNPDTGEETPGTGEKIYVKAMLSIDGTTVDTVGVRQKGFYSNWGAEESVKKPLKIDFNEFVAGNKYDGIKKVNLQNAFQDPSMMRDVLAYKLFRDVGIKAPRTAYAKVYLNDTYWGLYVMVEQVNKTFLKENFSSGQGNLYKCIDNTNLAWQGTTVDAYTDEFELKTNEEENDWSAFIEWVNVINNSAGASFDQDLGAVFETDDYLKILALDVLMKNWDSYYDHGRNFYVYQNPDSDKFHWIPWDYNLSFSNTGVDVLLQDLSSDFPGDDESKPLTENIMANEALKKHYLETMCDLIHQYFNASYLNAYIDETANLIRDDLTADTNKFYTMNEFEAGLMNGNLETPGIKSFIASRSDEVSDEFEAMSFECYGIGVEELLTGNDLKIYPNPATDILHVNLDSSKEPIYVTVYNATGTNVLSDVSADKQFTLNLGGLSPGLYHVSVRSGSTLLQQKLIVQ